jgi:hypothetical protein
MPAIADITVKKANGTTDVTFTKLTASGGDKSPAIWQSLTSGTSKAARHIFMMLSQPNGTNTYRRVSTKFTFPYMNTAGENKVLVVSFESAIPADITDTDLDEAIHQGCNLNASALIKSSFKEGYAPT